MISPSFTEDAMYGCASLICCIASLAMFEIFDEDDMTMQNANKSGMMSKVWRISKELPYQYGYVLFVASSTNSVRE